MNIKTLFCTAAMAGMLIGCHNDETHKTTASSTTQMEKPPVFEYGFNLKNFYIVKDTVKEGDTFGKLLEHHHMTVSDIHQISQQTSAFIHPKNFRVGKPYAFLYRKGDTLKPYSFVYQPTISEYIVVHLADSIYAYKEQKRIIIKEKAIAGSISNNLSVDAQQAGISANATYQLGQIFDYTIDFFRLQKGDQFKIIYDERYVDDTIYAGVERVRAAYFRWGDKSYYAFNFTTDSIAGTNGFYDENGNMMKRMFLQSPLDIFRITSKFGMRFHPILHRMKGHFGTDYAAPAGTPIRTTAAGTVAEAGFGSGNGNYVKVRHNGTYTTQYLHMQKILVRKGQQVAQGEIIGLVGSTGLATGPHVCYRFWKNGVQVDPLKEKFPDSVPIEAKLKEAYMEYIAPLKKQLDEL
jgi:peptidase M23B